MAGLIEWLIEVLGRFVIATISTFGYTGIVITMAIESACIPLPSEIIMPFSGYLVSTGQFSMMGVTLAGAIGNVLGSLVAYYVGVWGGRPFVERYGRYVLVSQHDMELADRWFAKHGEAAVISTCWKPGAAPRVASRPKAPKTWHAVDKRSGISSLKSSICRRVNGKHS